MAVNAGQKLTAATYNTDVLGGTVIKRGARTTNSSTTTTEVGVLRVDGAATKAGRLYAVTTNVVGVDTSVANDGGRLNLHYATGGSAATTSSTVLDLAQQLIPNAAHSEHFSASATYAPGGSDQTLSVLLCVARSTGSGSVGVLADPTFPCELLIWDVGEDPGNTGVAI